MSMIANILGGFFLCLGLSMGYSMVGDISSGEVPWADHMPILACLLGFVALLICAYAGRLMSEKENGQ